MIVDPQSPIPIFRQIAAQLRQRIAAGVYQPNEALPSQRRLARETQVNPNTIQKAYDELAREGLVESHRGAGLFVVDRSRAAVAGQAERRLDRELSRAVADALKSGIAPQRIRTLFREALQSKVASSLRRLT